MIKISKTLLTIGIALAQAACTLPSAIKLPDQKSVSANTLSIEDIQNLPEPAYQIMPGDTLRIVRDNEEVLNERSVLFEIRTDGNISYPYAGTIKAGYRSIKEVEDELTEKLTPIYREPHVTINITASPSNKVFVGGAVRLPNAFELNNIRTVEQAIISAGGLLNSADARHVALLRMDPQGDYKIYFSNYDKILNPAIQTKGIKLARGDIVFVPKSDIGNAVDGVDMYLNQLIPFTKSLGLGFSYVLHQPNLRVSQ